jgi:peptidoglycan-associated lipoprotein
MMSKWNVMCMAGLVVAISMVGSGCKKRGAAGMDDGISPINGIAGEGIYGEGLGDRFGGEFVEGQFQAVYYAYDSAQVSPAERSKLEAVADYLRRNSAARLVVEGHCDERGSREYNLSLGERRALAARAYLVGLGIDGSRIQTRSYGSEQPAAFGHDEESWRLNRRAEFVVVQ